MVKRPDGDMRYLEALKAASPSAFEKFLKATELARHREVVPVEASCAASLVGVMAEDCGPCVQIVVDLARSSGVSETLIEAVLSADRSGMDRDAELGYRFARAIVARSLGADDARQAVRERWGDKGVVDLTLAAQFNRMFPMLKAGLGYAEACRQIAVGEKLVRPAIK